MGKTIKEVSLSRMKVRTLCTLVMLLIMLSIFGCAGNKPLLQQKITFWIKPDKSVNNAQPLYIVIRDVNKKSFLIEDYDEIADLVYTDSPDESLLTWHLVIPGRKEEITVEVPGKSDLGFYAMFTQPEENWKIMFERPLESEYEIIIQDNSLKYKKEKKGFWKWLLGIF
ncbi:MAG: hypothetical protein MUO43_18370 [Desulfobacterales bacterium]|nr:hypothetical protein [Desulfobacterales bacterium]